VRKKPAPLPSFVPKQKLIFFVEIEFPNTTGNDRQPGKNNGLKCCSPNFAPQQRIVGPHNGNKRLDPFKTRKTNKMEKRGKNCGGEETRTTKTPTWRKIALSS